MQQQPPNVYYVASRDGSGRISCSHEVPTESLPSRPATPQRSSTPASSAPLLSMHTTTESTVSQQSSEEVKRPAAPRLSNASTLHTCISVSCDSSSGRTIAEADTRGRSGHSMTCTGGGAGGNGRLSEVVDWASAATYTSAPPTLRTVMIFHGAPPPPSPPVITAPVVEAEHFAAQDTAAEDGIVHDSATTTTSNGAIRNEDHYVNDPSEEFEVHSCLTLSSTCTSPTASQEALALPCAPTDRPESQEPPLNVQQTDDAFGAASRGNSETPTSADRHVEEVEEVEEVDESRPLLSSGSSPFSSVQTTLALTETLTPTAHVPEEVPSPSPVAPPTAAPTASTVAPLETTPAGPPVAAAMPPAQPYRLLDSEPSGNTARSKGEVRIDAMFNAIAAARDAATTTAAAPNTEIGPPQTTAEEGEGGVSAAVTPTPAMATTTTTTTTTTSGSSASGGGDTLSEEQRYAYQLAVREHRTVFITGGAGTGKSHLLRTIIRGMPASSTFVTATTGIAALNLSGTTLHSFVGCGVPDASATPAKILSIVRSKTRVVRNWRLCRALIIDEVSMLEASFFDLVDYIARHIRNRPEEPFGGIQLILSGDFLQLPPVVRERRSGSSAPFCFETETWMRVNPKICLLSTPFRQRDLRFFKVLNEMRFGDLKPESIALLHSIDTTNRVHFVRRVPAADDVSADEERRVVVGLKRERDGDAVPGAEAARGDVGLAATAATTTGTNVSSGGNGAAQETNAGSLSSIFYDPPARPGERQTRLELVDGTGRPINAAFDGYTILRSTRAEVESQNERYFNQLDTEIYTYVGAHSGAGAFPDKHLTEVVQLRKGCRVMVIKNFDSTTKLVNGSTGTVTGFVSFAKNYRFQSPGITGSDARDLCVGHGRNMERRHTMLPLVAFDARDASGQTRVDEIVVEPQEWVEKEGDRVKSRSVQIPLVQAYAITIHKSQGMSLTQVDIDFAKVFEAGQSYVALSRCTDLQRVRLHGFSVHLVSANSIALAYYKALRLQQQRLEWQRQHMPQVVAVTEAVEARSCTPYGYVLPNERDVLLHYGEEDSAHGVYKHDTDSEEESAEESGGDGNSSEEERLSDEGSNRGFEPRGNEERRDAMLFNANGRGEGTQRRRGRSRDGKPVCRSQRYSLSQRPPRRRPEEATRYEEENDNLNDTQRLDVLRRRITPFLHMADVVKRLVLREMTPLRHVRNSRLVMDVNALLHLVTGAESATLFDDLFGAQENMMRVPMCVQELIEEAAAYRSPPASLTPSATPEQVTFSQQQQQQQQISNSPIEGHCGHRHHMNSGPPNDDSAAHTGWSDAGLLAASDVAAEALAIMARAKQEFILDVQRVEQTAALPVPSRDWLRFADVLPLLQQHQPPQRVPGQTVSAPAASSGNAVMSNSANSAVLSDTAAQTSREVNFILNRDPRETVQHRAILEYALFLKASFGQNVAVCTDSISLAAYALAWGLRVVSVECFV